MKSATLRLTRVFSAPRQKVFSAWTDPEKLGKWFHVGEDWQTLVYDIDFRIGGSYRLGMKEGDGKGPYSASGYFGQLKSLAGSWQGKGMGEKTVSVTYEVVANGSAVMERMRNEDEPEMVTIYHLDGDRLMMTHYCSAMNQPRMVADLSKGLSFHMIDITNLADEKAGHMKAMSIDIKDENHISHHWTFSKDGQDRAVPIMLERVMLTRK